MDNWDGPDLTTLVVDVDHTASRALFDRRRKRHRLRRRILGGGLGAAVVVLGVILGWSALDDDGESIVATGPRAAGPSGPVAFEVLEQRPAVGDRMGQLRAATTDAELAQLWSGIGFTGEPPTVDFDDRVVVSVTIPDDACPPELVSFARMGEVITPEFQEPARGCNEPLIPKTYLAAIERDSVSPAFVLRLPADSLYDFDEQRLRVELTPVTRAGSAEVIVELVDAPDFHEGFDYAVRFRDSESNIVAERWLDGFDPVGDAGTTRTWQAVFRLPAGAVTVESHLTTGLGPGPVRPDFSTESGAPLCPPQRDDLAPGRAVRLTLNWQTGCLVRPRA
jgi:hypothetical protein